ncbi:hypothetical protein FA95DRAFT_1684134 [Auriscalpium vulgare]|uniref:Uncharacterized protein n=1 Tax=Auriscalpium vulgare TaxID=40419 RepID=A0ACB8R846_9AGAM|nr:hypothetical protein FA95DRAFT_1684134 [Auriscalpium vulgare]
MSSPPPAAIQGYSVDEPAPAPPAATDIALPASPPPAAVSPPPGPPPQHHEPEPAPAPVRQAADTPALPERPAEDEFADPQIASLHAIFPDFDAALLQSVLESVGGNEDRAVDALLGMSDPEHVPTAAPPPNPNPQRTLTQEELDEEFARQLMLQDEQEYQQRRQAPLAYTPRAGRPQGLPPAADPERAPGADGQKDTMADVQEHISRIAETGKRTFSSLVSKVKAKVQEFDQARNTPQGQGPSSAAGTQPSWGTPGGQPGLDRHAQAAYYAPRAPADAPPAASASANSANAPAPRPSLAPAEGGATPPPPSTSPGRPNIDAGKIGLLPKRPVSLVGAGAGAAGRQPDDEDDELEYVENPFEEGPTRT